MIQKMQQTEVCKIITDISELAEIARLISRETVIAVDLEMDSLHNYCEKVCLIQISTRKDSWLIDPLAIKDLSVLAASLSNPDIKIVMHGSDYDIRSMHRDFGIEINNLFDTMIASRLLGFTDFGLAALLKARFGIELNKKYQKADWSKRPLSEEMCAYAAADTSDLLPLYDQLKEELIHKSRLSWLEEECNLVCQARVTEKEGPLFLSFKGAGKLKGRNLAILEGLLQLRDQQAKEQDRPAFKIISGETLLEVAEKRPRSINDLSSIKGMTPGQIQRYGETIMMAISAALNVPEDQLPYIPRQHRIEPAEGTKERIKHLKEWRSEKSRLLGLEPGVLAPNWLLESIAEANPVTVEALGSISGIRNWQIGLFGQELLAELAIA